MNTIKTFWNLPRDRWYRYELIRALRSGVDVFLATHRPYLLSSNSRFHEGNGKDLGGNLSVDGLSFVELRPLGSLVVRNGLSRKLKNCPEDLPFYDPEGWSLAASGESLNQKGWPDPGKVDS